MRALSSVISTTLALVAGAATAGDGMMMTKGETATLGDLTIEAPFAFATLPNQPVAGGFMAITNAGDAPDTLIAASSPAAGRMEIHEMAMDGDVMRMREIEGGLVIPAGETVKLEPGGFHVMFMELSDPMVAGEMTDVTLTFEDAGEVTLTFPVVKRPMGAGHGKMDHEGSNS